MGSHDGTGIVRDWVFHMAEHEAPVLYVVAGCRVLK